MLKKIFNFHRAPPYLLFFVTNRCNMRCGHCFFWEKINSGAPELSVEEIRQVARSLPGLIFLRVTGGEPFMRGDIADIVGAFYHHSGLRRISIATNGLLTSDILKNTEKILAGLRGMKLEIGISIDGLYEKHDSLRRHKGAFESAINTFNVLKELRKRFSNLRVGFITTMMKGNQDDFKDTFDFLAGLEPDSIGLNLIRGTPSDASQLEVDIEKLRDAYALINSFNERKIVRHSLFDTLRYAKTLASQAVIVETFRHRKMHVKCNAGDKIAVLYPDGNVSACELLDHRLGNVRDFGCDFMRLWNSGTRTGVLKQIRQSRCFCTHECFVTSGLIFEAGNLLKIMRNAVLILLGRADFRS